MGHHKTEIPEDVHVPAKSLWAKLPIIGVILGVIGFGLGLSALAMDGHNSEHVAYAYLFAYIFWLSISLGGMIFVLIQHATKAGWSVAIRRIGENLMVSVVLFAVLAIPFLFLWPHDLFPWTHQAHVVGDHALEAKAPYLDQGFWTIRSIIYIVVWLVVAGVFYSWSVKQDKGGNKELSRKMIKFSYVAIPLYALSQTFAIFDWVMSLQPHWYSTIFGVYFFASSILAAYALMILISMGLQKAGMVKKAITTEHFHGMGIFTFGHTVFWSYIAFSQFMLIWYANIPEEVEFFYHRVHPDHGWGSLSYTLPIAGFAIPFFFLLSRHVKRHRMALAIACLWVLGVRVLDVYWLVMPMAGQNSGHAEHFPSTLIWVDMCLWMGIGGLFFAVFGFFLKRTPVAPIGDPRMIESIEHEHFTG